MLILVQKQNEQDQAHIYQETNSESCKIHQLTIMYHFKHTNHCIYLNFLFQSLTRFFCMRVIFVSYIFHL